MTTTSQPCVLFYSDFFYIEFLQLQTQVLLHGAAQHMARPTRLHNSPGAFTFLGLLLLAGHRRVFLVGCLLQRLPWHVDDIPLRFRCQLSLSRRVRKRSPQGFSILPGSQRCIETRPDHRYLGNQRASSLNQASIDHQVDIGRRWQLQIVCQRAHMLENSIWTDKL